MVDVQGAMAAASQSEQAPVEPLLDASEIQGNVVPGFMKPHLAVIALALGDVPPARQWILQMVPSITTLAGVMPSRLKVRAERLARRVTAGFASVVSELDDRWLNIAFSYRGIAALLASNSPFAGDAPEFTDAAFTSGMAARSPLLGDPTDPGAEGYPGNWRFGGPGKGADILLVFGTDRADTMTAFVSQVRDGTVAAGMTVLYEQRGHKLNAAGAEHFGFQDGVSQPGVRGRISEGPDTYLTPRTIDPGTVPESWLWGQPGQYLVWPGEFVLGYPTEGADPVLPGPPRLPGPPWSRNGSYLVYRRLRQDVTGFRAFVEGQAKALRSQPGFAQVTAAQLAAQLVGRWPSGAPVSRTPAGDDPALGRDPLANNDFGFATDTATLPLLGGLIGGDATAAYPEAKADPIGLTCPLAAHIRKVNPRDVGNDQGGRRASFRRRILRRGLPYGTALPESGADPDHGDRGLMFLCYQASIVDQFEFLAQAWMNDPVAPRSPGGHDLVVGQNGQPGEDRERSCVLVRASGDVAAVTAAADVVIPTGGGYFFSPSISALQDVLGAG